MVTEESERLVHLFLEPPDSGLQVRHSVIFHAVLPVAPIFFGIAAGGFSAG